jgi:hypothetical protein
MSFYIKLFLLAVLILLCASTLRGEELPENFLKAINQVEAGGRKTGSIIGDGGRAIGPFQIHRVYWQDANVAGKYEDCKDYAYSVKVMTAYLNRYARQAIRDKNFEKLARIHNGGPQGHTKQATIKYWLKVKKHL